MVAAEIPLGTPVDERRLRRLLESAVAAFGLDLQDLIVLTEAATGHYALTPVIAALAGARTYALARDSRYGSTNVAAEHVQRAAESSGVGSRVEVLSSRDDPRIGEADIVTNLGHVRPLDAPFLTRLKRTAVIPLMWETWEHRSEDLDLAACRRLGLPVLGTNEMHPALRFDRYLGLLGVKLLFEVGLEVAGSRVVVVGGDRFGRPIARGLQRAGAEAVRLHSLPKRGVRSDGDLAPLEACEALVIAEHERRDMIVGRDGDLTPDELYALNPGVTVVHIAGAVDRAPLAALGIRCHPSSFAPAGHMSVTADHLGPRPLVELHTAGLRVGELMARARLSGLGARDAELSALRDPLAQDFADSLVRE